MSKKHKQKLNLHSAFRQRGKSFIRYYPLMAMFMGRHNSFFLTVLNDLHDYFDKMKMIESGVMFFSKEQFKREKDISTYHQRQALPALTALSILRVVADKGAPGNRTYIRFSPIGCFVWGLLISDLDEKFYAKLWHRIQTSTDAQKVIRREIRKLEKEWNGIELNGDSVHLPKRMKSGYKNFVKMVRDIYKNEYFDADASEKAEKPQTTGKYPGGINL